jgi:hypothetical protein
MAALQNPSTASAMGQMELEGRRIAGREEHAFVIPSGAGAFVLQLVVASKNCGCKQ